MLKSRGSKNYTVAFIVVVLLIIAYFYMSRQESKELETTQTETTKD